MRASEFLTLLTVLCAVLRSTGAAVQEARQHHEALSRAEQDMSRYVHTTETPPKRDISLSKVRLHVLEATADEFSGASNLSMKPGHNRAAQDRPPKTATAAAHAGRT